MLKKDQNKKPKPPKTTKNTKNSKTERADAQKKKLKVPSILTYTRKVKPSDGFFYGTKWDERHTRQAESIHLQQKPARRTNSNADLRFDLCFLPHDCDTLLLKYTVKFLAGVEEPWECNEPDFARKYTELIENFKSEYGFNELASRYAQNIANGRALWRNRIDAKEIEVVVTAEGKTWTFDAQDFSIRNFDNTAAVSELAGMIEDALSGKIPHLIVEVKTYAAMFGGMNEVYPSEEKRFFDEKTGDRIRILYESEGIAAFHSQKIGNAIRTIDTWYPAHGTDDGIGPIPAEVYGITIIPDRVFRPPHESDFYTIFDQAVADGYFQNAAEAHYAVAVLVRGGNFGTRQFDKRLS